MKKYLLISTLAVLMSLTFASCEKDEVENTATVEMAGEWHIHVSAVNPETGEVDDPDWFGDGVYNITTCNTAANDPNKMFLIDDYCYYYPYQVEIEVDPSTMTFKATNAENLFGATRYGGEHVTITGGKIVKDGYTTGNGQKVDYIEFYLSMDPDALFDYLEGDVVKVSGYRYTGFVEDE